MPQESANKEQAARARELAIALLDSDEGYLDNVIELSRLGSRLVGDIWHTEFHVFGEIESETDHLPTKHVRPLCSRSMLERSDEELKEVIGYYKNDLVAACNEILSKYKGV